MPCREINGGGSCRTYLVWSARTKEALLVDPLLERTEAYRALLLGEGLSLQGLIDTHTHADHLSGCAKLQDETGAPYLMHGGTKVSCVARRLEDGETLGLGEETVSFLHTPGHTKDSMTLRLSEGLLSGDFLFIGSQGAGRLDLPGSDPATHYESLRKLDRLPDELALLPAHDYQGNLRSTLGAERRVNPVLQPRARDAYVRWWLDKKFGPAGWMEDVVRANAACTRDPKAVQVPKEGYACACVSAATDETFPQISPADLAEKLRLAPGSLVLLDVRTQDEYDNDGRIEGTILIPVDELEGRLSEVPPGPLVSICRSGKRAAKAAGVLKKAGRSSEIWVLAGGMLAWNDQGLPAA